jgi:Rad3-related DNA helicase
MRVWICSRARLNHARICKTKKRESSISRFANFFYSKAHLMADVKDIEDTAELGKRIGSCSYYGTRGSLGSAEIVTLPYNLMLMKSAREALKIEIKGNIVIFDEAHNSMCILLTI